MRPRRPITCSSFPLSTGSLDNPNAKERGTVTTVRYVEENEADGKVKAIYADIKTVFGIPFVPNLFTIEPESNVRRFVEWVLERDRVRPAGCGRS